MEYPKIRAFKLTVAMDEWLKAVARENHRRVGDMIRMLLLELMEKQTKEYESQKDSSHG